MKIKEIKKSGKRLVAGALCCALAMGFLPMQLQPNASAAEGWVQDYLHKLVDWSIMRGDQEGNLEEDRPINRAEYASMINRAYGYTEAIKTPFEDVLPTAWYAEDIGIGFKAGYFSGTSENTASPEDLLTREQAAVILGRNMMMQPSAGESLDFSDSRDLGEWSRGIVKTATTYGVLKGYPDGSFRPQENITRGEVASMLVNALGTPVSSPGDRTLGSVYGNVTITSSGVTLRDTVIAGDLYLTGGVGLGDVRLENVTVLGRIIASGAGASNKGDASIVLRNVTAKEMIIDAPANQFVSIRAEGDTLIDKTSVRTPAYVEDMTENEHGLKKIEIDGEDSTALTAAGNLKEIINLTSDASLVIARGTAASVTMDERGVGGKLSVEQGATVKELQLDTAVKVIGKGDIGHLTISSPGSTTEILPDKTTIRPGLTADVKGEEMNTVTADEASQEPRILSGYPRAGDVAPKEVKAVFSGNKGGTIYWAVSSITDGSVTEDDLVSPPSYGSKIVRSGNVKAGDANKEYTEKVNNLTSDGSYYLSAVLVDSRGQRSPVKVTAFTTPDDSVPNFATGFPYMSKIEDTSAQAAVMTTKTCKLYYALMPKGAAAPTGTEFKAGAVSGNLGYGVKDAIKSEPLLFSANDKALKELEEYDLYVWLNDADGAKSSAVKKVSFKTVDKTPPKFMTEPTVTTVQAAAIELTTMINEAGTVFWVVVKADSEYPKPLANESGTTGEVPLHDPIAKMQVAAGMNALKSGRVAMQEGKDAKFNITGLSAETSYDLYYVAQDKAGNFSDTVKKMRLTTLDTNAPSATLDFDKFNGNEKDTPSANTNAYIRFSEGVQTYPEGLVLTELYKAVQTASTDTERKAAKDKMANALSSVITMYDLTDGTEEPAPVRTADTETAVGDDWAIDYRNAKIVSEDSKTVIELPTTASSADSALNLRSGSTYRFDLKGLSDISRNPTGTIILPERKGFTTLFAQVNLKQATVADLSAYIDDTVANKPTVTPADKVTLHMSFEVKPDATKKVADSICWDMLLWTDTSLKFQVFRRELSGNTPGDWHLLGEDEITLAAGGEKPIGTSLTARFLQKGSNQPQFEQLNTLDDTKTYEYGISFTALDGNATADTWSKTVEFKVGIAAGSNNELGNMSSDVTPSRWKANTEARLVTSIGNSVAQGSDELLLRKAFSDKIAPVFTNGYPKFSPGDSSAMMSVMLDRPGTLYYVAAPLGLVNTVTVGDVNVKETPEWEAEIPEDGEEASSKEPSLKVPGFQDVVANRLSGGNADIKWGTAAGGPSVSNIVINDLKPETEYIVYYVLKGSSSVYSTHVQAYRFKTEKVVRPVITLDPNNPSVTIKVDRNSKVDYVLITEQGILPILNKPLVNNAETPPPAPYNDPDYTLYDALLANETVDGISKGSIFDKYASTPVKESLASYIRTQTTDPGIALKGQKNVQVGQDVTINCSDSMVSNALYLFIAVGTSELLGSGDAFTGTRPLQLLDNIPPQVISYTSTLRAGAGGYNGELYVAFSEPIYQIVDNGNKPQTVVGVEAVTGPTPTKPELTPLGNHLALSTGVIDIAPNNIKGKAMESVIFKFVNVAPGTPIIFPSDFGDQAKNKPNNALVLTLVSPEVPGGEPTIKITPDWDGTK